MQYPVAIAVVTDVTSQKENRGDERRNHAVAMRDFVSALDENKTGGQAQRTQAVERGVDGRQIVDAHGSCSSWRTAATMRGRTAFVQSTPSPTVSNEPRNCACLSTMTKIVV